MKRHRRLNKGFTPTPIKNLATAIGQLVRGFTLLEVIVAVAILSGALLPIISWMPQMIQTKRKSEQQTLAVFLAQSKVEELRQGVAQKFDADYKATEVAFGAPYQDFRYTITDNLNSTLKDISVKVWHIEHPDEEIIFYTQAALR